MLVPLHIGWHDRSGSECGLRPRAVFATPRTERRAVGGGGIVTPKKLADQLQRLRDRVATLGDTSVASEVQSLTEILLEMMEENRDLRVENDQLKETLRSSTVRTVDAGRVDAAEQHRNSALASPSHPARRIVLEPSGTDGVVFAIHIDGEEPMRMQKKGSKAVPVLVAMLRCQENGRVFTNDDIVQQAPEAFLKVDSGGRVVPMSSHEVSPALRSYMRTVDGWLKCPSIAAGRVRKSGTAQWTFEPTPGSVKWDIQFGDDKASESPPGNP